MPIIAYQSFNANASSTHGLAQSSLQRFTRDANAHASAKRHKALVLPSDTSVLAEAFHGPAHLRTIEPLGSSQTANVFGTQIALLWQNAYRAFGAMPDIMVCGELDVAHADFAKIVTDTSISLESIPAKRACQSFSAISQSGAGSKLADGEGYCVYAIGNLNVVFVHVPNKVAGKRPETELFYTNIAQALTSASKVIHLVIGDTNQPSHAFTAAVLNKALGQTGYESAVPTASITKVDNVSEVKTGGVGRKRKREEIEYPNVVEGGTNAKGTEMYDVAVYRSDLLKLEGVAYISQSSGATTVTDHCGLAVKLAWKT